MPEKKSRATTRKTKTDESDIETKPARSSAANAGRKSLRRLPPSPGMDDIAVPMEMESVEENTDVTETVSQETVFINHASAAIDAQNIHGSLHAVEHIRTEEETKSTFNGTVSEDFAPKPIQDTNFLASEYTSFDLRPKKSRNWFATFMVWLLSILIVIGIAAAVVLYVYPQQASTWYKDIQSKFFHHDDNQNSQNNNQQPAQAAAPVTPSQTKFGTVTTLAPLAQAIDAAVQSKYSDYSIDSNVDPSTVSSLNLSNDTLLYKANIVDQAQQLSSYFLSQFGLQLKLQEADNIPDDAVLYLTPLISSPNLNGKTAIVYNAKGVSGAAKTMCQVLQSYKSGTCTSANATATTQGLSVSYKDISTYLILARTQQFSGATFQVAPASQTADFVVTIGK